MLLFIDVLNRKIYFRTFLQLYIVFIQFFLLCQGEPLFFSVCFIFIFFLNFYQTPIFSENLNKKEFDDVIVHSDEILPNERKIEEVPISVFGESVISDSTDIEKNFIFPINFDNDVLSKDLKLIRNKTHTKKKGIRPDTIKKNWMKKKQSCRKVRKYIFRFKTSINSSKIYF